MQIRPRLERFSQFLFSEKTAPFAFLVVLLFSFGIFIPAWGFYFDDWPMVYLIHNQGDILQFYTFDRPFAAWTDIFLKTFLGTSPIAWQTANLLMRWAAVLGFWWCLKLIWPLARKQAVAAAMLFAVYPVFFQQAIAVTYTHVFLWYALYFLSVGLMVAAAQNPRWFYRFTLLSLLAAAVHILSVEYFWGLELLRPVLLWMILSENSATWKRRLRKAALNWMPYLALLGGAAFWRFFVLQLESDPNPPKMLFALLESPLSAVSDLLQTILRDGLYILASTWSRSIQPETIVLNLPSSLASWGLALLTAVFVGLYLIRTYQSETAESRSSSAWARQAMLLGGYALLVGMIPPWVTGRQAAVGFYSDRFALPAMLGASLLIAGLVFYLASKKHKIFILAVLIGLSTGAHFRIGNDYRWDWTCQKNFYWQLYWRAPMLEPDTALLSEGGIFRFVTKYSISTALNTLYPVPPGTTDLPYWAFELDDLGIDSGYPLGSADLTATLRTLSHTSSSRNGIVISYPKDSFRCLWVLSPADADTPYMPYYTSLTLEFSNLDRILPETNAVPDRNIFGPEPARGWCYYFQKASLARQFGDWETIRTLGDEARSLGYEPNNLYERMPFIEGDIHIRDWEMAELLTKEVFLDEPKFQQALCVVWARATSDMTLSPDEKEIVNSITSATGCKSP